MARSTTDGGEIVLSPNSYPPKNTGSMMQVLCGKNEYVEWHWLNRSDGSRVVVGYTIKQKIRKKQSHTTI